MSGSESFKLPEKFNLKILPFSTKEGEEIQSKKVLLVFEDLKTLAAKSSPGSLTLKQFKKRLPSGARFCNEAAEEVSESMTLSIFVENSQKNCDAIAAEKKNVKTIVVWYIEPTKQPGQPNTPKISLSDVMPQQPTSKFGSEQPYQAPTLSDLSEQRGKMNQQSIAELLDQVGANPASIAAELSNRGLHKLQARDWKVIEDKLKYLYGYYPGEGEFLKASIPGQEAEEDEEGQGKPASANEMMDGYLIERIIPNYRPINDSKVKAVAYDSEDDKQLAISGFDHKTSQIALGLAIPKFGAGVSAKHETFTEKEKKESHITTEKHIVGTWTHPIVELLIDSYATEIHPTCKKRMDDLIQKGTYDMAKKFLKDFGTAFSTRVRCGGRLHTDVTRVATSDKEVTTEQKQMETAIHANIKASFMGGLVSGTLSAGHTTTSGSGSTTSGSTLEQTSVLSWAALGGDPIYAQNPGKWLPTVANFTRWEVIEHIEVKPMIDAFDDFPGYESFSAIMRALISPGKRLPVTRLPWLSSMKSQFGQLPKDTQAIGYSFSSVPLKSIRSESPPFRVSPNYLVNNNVDDGLSTPSWFLVKDDNCIGWLIDSYMPWVGQKQGAQPLPEFVHHLAVSEKSFTVILNCSSKELTQEVSPEHLQWQDTAIKLSTGDSTDDGAFESEFGDRFVTGVTTQRLMFGVFRFYFDRISDFNSAGGEVLSQLSKRSVFDGCNWIKDLLSKSGVQCDALVFSSDESSGGYTEKTWLRLHPHQMDMVRDRLDSVWNADSVPVSLITRSFTELLPHLRFPSYQNFSPNQADAFIGARFELIKAYAKTIAKTRTPLLRDGTGRTDHLHQSIGRLASSFRSLESSLTGFGYPKDEVKTLSESVENAEFEINCQLAACDWIRRSILREVDLWKFDIPKGTSYKKHTAEFDWAPHEADRFRWGNKVVDHINARVQRPADQRLDYEWTFASNPSDFHKIEVRAPSACCLVGYKMISNNGSVCGGGCWFPSSFHNGNAVAGAWKREEDLFVWRQEPKIAHERKTYYSHHWALRTWWLSEDEFPFHKDRLYDFDLDGVNHRQPSKAY